MDWGATLGGLDQELASVVARNKLHNDEQMGLLKQINDIRVGNRSADRLEAAQRAQENYWNQMADSRSREVDVKEQQAQKVLADEAERLAEGQDIAQEQDPQVRAQKIINYRAKWTKSAIPTDNIVYQVSPDGTVKPMAGIVQGAGAKFGPTGMGFELDAPTAEAYAKAIRQGAGKEIMGLIGRNQMARAQIMRLAVRNMPEGQGLAGNIAQYGALKNALKNTEAMHASAEALAKGVGANIKLYEDAVNKIPDTGIPYLNGPLRSLNEKLIGSPVVTNARAYALPALREYVKLTGGITAQGGGGVLHQKGLDDANKVLADIDNANLEQINGAVAAMKADLENMRNAYTGERDSLIGDIEALGAFNDVSREDVKKDIADAAKQEAKAAATQDAHEAKVEKAIEGTGGTISKDDLAYIAKIKFGDDIKAAAAWAVKNHITVQ